MNHLIAYNDLRRALVALDDMPADQLHLLECRAVIASEKYQDNSVTPAQNAMNDVLRAYATYVRRTLEERKSLSVAG